MSLIDDLAFVLFIHCAIWAILDKYGKIDWMKQSLANSRFKILYKLQKCEFCITHHLAIVPTVIQLLIFEYNVWDWFLPLMTAGALQLKR